MSLLTELGLLVDMAGYNVAPTALRLAAEYKPTLMRFEIHVRSCFGVHKVGVFIWGKIFYPGIARDKPVYPDLSRNKPE